MLPRCTKHHSTSNFSAGPHKEMWIAAIIILVSIDSQIVVGCSKGYIRNSIKLGTKIIYERVHNARHKNVTSALNTTFFKTSGL